MKKNSKVIIVIACLAKAIPDNQRTQKHKSHEKSLLIITKKGTITFLVATEHEFYVPFAW